MHTLWLTNGTAHGPFTGDPFWDALIGVSIITAAIAGVVALLRGPWRRFKAISDFVETFADDWNGVPDRPGVKGRAGVMVRLDTIEHEITPNSGGSLKDIAVRTEKKLDDHLLKTGGNP